MDATDRLVKNIAATNYQDLSGEVVNATKKTILDSLAVSLAGSSASGINEIADMVKDWGGKQESSILLHGIKIPAPNASLVNAVMIHALDYDDTHDAAVIHTGAATIPAALAISERKGGVRGQDFITAVALGADLACRMALATKFREGVTRVLGGWHLTTLYGYFSAAAVAGRLLGLDEKRILNALGIAYHQASGNSQGVIDGALTKRMGPGFANKGGVIAALMAERGITGAKGCIEGKCGIFNLYHAGCDLDRLTLDLGKTFEGANVGFKPYPCCRITHRYIDVVLDVVKQYDINPEEVETIEAIVGTLGWETHSQPLDAKRKPRTIPDAQFSLPWVLACATVRRKVGVSEFTKDAITDPRLLAMAHRVTPIYDDTFEEKMDSPMDIKIKTTRGEFIRKTEAPWGSLRKPMTMKEVTDKLKACASTAIKPMPQCNIERITELVANLEKVEDMNDVIELLT